MITQAELKQELSYSRETGEFRWNRKSGCKSAGSVAGNLSFYGYVEIRVRGKLYKAHRLAWLYENGRWPDKQIDHINCNRQDNRLQNLREASNAENARNQPVRASNTSGIKGVSWHKAAGKWQAKIRGVDGRQIYLGLYSDAEEAKAAWMNAAGGEHREFKRA